MEIEQKVTSSLWANAWLWTVINKQANICNFLQLRFWWSTDINVRRQGKAVNRIKQKEESDLTVLCHLFGQDPPPWSTISTLHELCLHKHAHAVHWHTLHLGRGKRANKERERKEERKASSLDESCFMAIKSIGLQGCRATLL